MKNTEVFGGRNKFYRIVILYCDGMFVTTEAKFSRGSVTRTRNAYLGRTAAERRRLTLRHTLITFAR